MTRPDVLTVAGVVLLGICVLLCVAVNRKNS